MASGGNRDAGKGGGAGSKGGCEVGGRLLDLPLVPPLCCLPPATVFSAAVLGGGGNDTNLK